MNELINKILSKWKDAQNFNNGYMTGGAAPVDNSALQYMTPATGKNYIKQMPLTSEIKGAPKTPGFFDRHPEIINYFTQKLNQKPSGNTAIQYMPRAMGLEYKKNMPEFFQNNTSKAQKVKAANVSETKNNDNIKIDSPVGQKILSQYLNNGTQGVQTKTNTALPKLPTQKTSNYVSMAMNGELPTIYTIEPDGTIHLDDNNKRFVDNTLNAPTKENTSDTPTEELIQEQPYTGKFKGLVNGINDFYSGYRENRDNAFNPKNLIPQNHNVMTKLGESLGTLSRIAQSPMGQGLIAGGLSTALTGNPLYGLGNAYKFANSRAMSDIYNQVLKDNGINIPLGAYGNLEANDFETLLLPKENQLDRQYRAAQLQNNIDYRNRYLDNQAARLEFDRQKENQRKLEKSLEVKNKGADYDKDKSFLLKAYLNPKKYNLKAVLEDFFEEYHEIPQELLKNTGILKLINDDNDDIEAELKLLKD